MRILIALVAILLVAAGVVWWIAGRAVAPLVAIHQPGRTLGTTGTLEVTIDIPGGSPERVDITLQQGSRQFALFSLDSPSEAAVTQAGPTGIRIVRPIGRRAIPDLEAGAARLVVTATRTGFLGLRRKETTATRDLQVILTPPRISPVSTHHFVAHGGAEFVIYRVVPPEARSGVRVDNLFYPGYPATAVHVATDDPTLKAAFFALRWDQEPTTPVELYACDEAGNETSVPLDHRVIARTFARSRVTLTDPFLRRVVPDIVSHVPEIQARADGLSTIDAFLLINRQLRERNSAALAELAMRTAPAMLWTGPFVQLPQSKVEAGFADHRTYYYEDREVDQQVHLGFDLAVTAQSPVLAANAGRVLLADYLGIYGTCVVIDHGLGVQSLYGHLSSLAVSAGDEVAKGQTIGRTGMTGLAGGDHLHFTMLVGGQPVSPLEWWDPHWVQDRILRKIAEAR